MKKKHVGRQDYGYCFDSMIYFDFCFCPCSCSCSCAHEEAESGSAHVNGVQGCGYFFCAIEDDDRGEDVDDEEGCYASCALTNGVRVMDCGFDLD